MPTYLRDSTKIGIAHIGVGNFHRSHQAMYADRLLTEEPDSPWAISGIGTRPEDRPLITALKNQDGLYSLSLFDRDGSVKTRVIGSVRELILSADEPQIALKRLSDPAVHVVSLTITESGYVEDAANGRRAVDDDDVRTDAAADFSRPQTAFGLIVAALRARRAAGIIPFTVMSCDNIQGNGAVARASVVATARLVDDDLADWIGENVGFPSTMVDRITPRPTPDQVEFIERRLGVDDNAIVVAEPFTQWILEDDFRAGRPAWEKVGAIFTDNIGAYESMKLRLLNGAHQVLAYVGALRGHDFAHEAMRDAVVRNWLDSYWRELALPTLGLPVGVDGDEYIGSLIERFGNPAIADTLERLAADSSARMAKFILPVLIDARDRPEFHQTAAVVLGSWATAVAASKSPAISAGVSDAVHAAVRSNDDPCAFLSAADWLAPFAADERLRESVAAVRRAFEAYGASAALEKLANTRR
ncbi:MAG: mannitol dehydrogenase family protein [Microbacterium sp.]